MARPPAGCHVSGQHDHVSAKAAAQIRYGLAAGVTGPREPRRSLAHEGDLANFLQITNEVGGSAGGVDVAKAGERRSKSHSVYSASSSLALSGGGRLAGLDVMTAEASAEKQWSWRDLAHAHA